MSGDSEMVERVARAIYERQKAPHHAGWDTFCSVAGNRDAALLDARAAIAAMREIPASVAERMMDARDENVADADMWPLGKFQWQWMRMIDAALKAPV